jgi:CheY-like chemotaxis protein
MEDHVHSLNSETESWVRELEAAFAPYPAFVREVSEQIRLLSESFVEAEVRTRARRLPARRLLLVDDAELNRVLISHYLRELPVKIEFAPSLDRALQLCAQADYDAFLVDLELPGQEPSSLVSALRGASSGARLVALSSFEFTQEAEKKALEQGFEHYLSRGLARQELLKRLSGVLWPSG